MVKLVCHSCHKPLSIDETKLPMKEVTFPCPACKAKLTYDRRLSEGGAAAAPSPASQPAAAASLAVEPQGVDDDDDDFGSPKALIVGADHPGVRQAAKLIGLQVVHHADPAAARDFYLREYPSVVFLAPAQLTAPPLADMAPVTGVAPSDRRKGFFVLVADNLRTLDGNAAFLYNVNLVMATKDLPSFKNIYRDAMEFHRRLYQPMTAVRGAH